MSIELQSLLEVLKLGHILDTFGYFIGIIRGSTCKRLTRTRPGNGKI